MKVLLLYAAILGFAVAQDDYCFGKDTERAQTRQFTTRTAYHLVKGTNIDEQYSVPGCEPKKIWIFQRHGTRLPEVEIIKEAKRLEVLRTQIIENYREPKHKPDKDALCEADLKALGNWKWNTSITLDQPEYLTSQGYEELRGIAQFYQRYYPTVLPKDYNDTYYLFRHTDTQRTRESFKGFAEGIFGAPNEAKPAEISKKDLLLKPYSSCNYFWNKNFEKSGSESAKFRQSAIWNRTIENISKRLGYQNPLAIEDIELMYILCRFEQAWQVAPMSAWCAVFLPRHVTVLEYEDDLKNYYKVGYGFKRNARLNCRAVQDMLTHLNSSLSPHVVANFGHTTGLLTLITALGINRDNIPLKADNYNCHTNRLWKTSNMDPFAANFVAVKYQCGADSMEKVIFFLNQNAVDLDWCNVGLCNWSEVQKRYKSIADADCNEYFCRSGASRLASGIVIGAWAYSIVGLIAVLTQ